MNEEIKNAIKLLKNNGYIVKKWTKSMEQDASECEEMEEKRHEQRLLWMQLFRMFNTIDSLFYIGEGEIIK